MYDSSATCSALQYATAPFSRPSLPVFVILTLLLLTLALEADGVTLRLLSSRAGESASMMALTC
jgi:hypothetical protein